MKKAWGFELATSSVSHQVLLLLRLGSILTLHTRLKEKWRKSQAHCALFCLEFTWRSIFQPPHFKGHQETSKSDCLLKEPTGVEWCRKSDVGGVLWAGAMKLEEGNMEGDKVAVFRYLQGPYEDLHPKLWNQANRREGRKPLFIEIHAYQLLHLSQVLER